MTGFITQIWMLELNTIEAWAREGHPSETVLRQWLKEKDVPNHIHDHLVKSYRKRGWCS